jgi:hypothetical protein
MICSFIPSKPTRDGILCYMIEPRGLDTTYTIFSGYGMRHGIESEIAKQLVARYQNKSLMDTMHIVTSKCVIHGMCNVDTLTPPRLISFCANEYVFPNGDIQLVRSEFCKK